MCFKWKQSFFAPFACITKSIDESCYFLCTCACRMKAVGYHLPVYIHRCVLFLINRNCLFFLFLLHSIENHFFTKINLCIDAKVDKKANKRKYYFCVAENSSHTQTLSQFLHTEIKALASTAAEAEWNEEKNGLLIISRSFNLRCYCN